MCEYIENLVNNLYDEAIKNRKYIADLQKQIKLVVLADIKTNDIEKDKVILPQQEEQPIKKMPISALELTSRAENCLKGQKIDTIEQLISHSARQLLVIPNFGRKSLMEIRKELFKYELKLKED